MISMSPLMGSTACIVYLIPWTSVSRFSSVPLVCLFICSYLLFHLLEPYSNIFQYLAKLWLNLLVALHLQNFLGYPLILSLPHE